MLSERSTKAIVAIFALVTAVLLSIYLAIEAPLKDWWLVALLLAVSALLWGWMWQEDRASEKDTTESPPAQTAIHEANVKAETTLAKAAESVKKAEDAISPPPPKSTPIEPVSPIEKATPAETVTPVKETAPTEEVSPAEKAAPAEEIPPAAEIIPGDKQADDLTRVEGIGPKYQEVLTAAGITTFAQVAQADLARLEQIIKDAGMRRPASIETWAEQAGYAAKGDWEGLEKLQGELTGGRR